MRVSAIAKNVLVFWSFQISLYRKASRYVDYYCFTWLVVFDETWKYFATMPANSVGTLFSMWQSILSSPTVYNVVICQGNEEE